MEQANAGAVDANGAVPQVDGAVLPQQIDCALQEVAPIREQAQSLLTWLWQRPCFRNVLFLHFLIWMLFYWSLCREKATGAAT